MISIVNASPVSCMIHSKVKDTLEDFEIGEYISNYDVRGSVKHEYSSSSNVKDLPFHFLLHIITSLLIFSQNI